MTLSVQDFIARWKGSSGSEEANSQSFWKEFCEALELPAVDPKGLDDAYSFEKKIQLTHAEGRTSIGSADLYRQGCFVLEAKQGSTTAHFGSAPLRGTTSYERYMERAFGQAVNYAHSLPQRPPFVLTCDIGHALHVWEGFSGRYGGYGARRSFTMDDLLKAEVKAYLRAIWMDPGSLDPARKRALVTREVATEIGKLAASLEQRFPPKAVAAFSPMTRLWPWRWISAKSRCSTRPPASTGAKWIPASLAPCWKAPSARANAIAWAPITPHAPSSSAC